MQIAESPVTAKLAGTCSGGAGPDLTGYPHLVYAPLQWGMDVRTASNGQSVADLAARCEEQLSDLAIAATFYGVTLEELFDALRYARANGIV